jgi:dienelactone hydrolase
MKQFRPLIAIILAVFFSAEVHAKVVGQAIEYKHGVLVVHEWWGLNDYPKKRAEQLAGLGYVAFALDMYGKGVIARDGKEAAKLSGQFRDNPLMRHRARAGLKVLAENELVDPKRIAAIGFCFGGTTVLELAYSGADLVGIVSFHGGLTMPRPEDMDNIKARVWLLHGAEDPVAPSEKALAFQESMRKADVDWQMIYYGGAVHAFSNPAAGNDKTRGAAYDEKAARRSWKHMQIFFEEIF